MWFGWFDPMYFVFLALVLLYRYMRHGRQNQHSLNIQKSVRKSG